MPPAPTPTVTETKQPNIFERARAMLQRKNPAPKEGAAQSDATPQLAAQLNAANARIADLTQQVADLKSSLAAIENGAVIPPAALATLGFPASALPPAASFPEHTLESLQTQFKQETDPDKRAELAARIIKMRDR